MAHYNVTVVVSGDTASDAEDAVEAALEPFSEHHEVDPYPKDIETTLVELALDQENERRREAGDPPLTLNDETALTAAVSAYLGVDVVRRDDGSLYYLSTWNPEGRWDFWNIGGRWSDSFLTKDGTRSDLVRVRDLDLAAMQDEAAQEAHLAYDKFEAETAGMAIPPRWETVLERHNQNIDEARAEFNADPWVQAAVRGVDDPHARWCIGAENPRLQFVDRAVATTGVPYAWLQDGHWEQGGYIGMLMALSNGPDQKEPWEARITSRWADLDGDLWVATVDCHK